jgi:hypothetical protein
MMFCAARQAKHNAKQNAGEAEIFFYSCAPANSHAKLGNQLAHVHFIATSKIAAIACYARRESETSEHVHV